MSKLRVIGEPQVITENEVDIVVEMESLVELYKEYGRNLFSPNIREYLLTEKPKSEKLKNKLYRSMTNTLKSIDQIQHPKGDEFKKHNNGARLSVNKFQKLYTDGNKVTVYDIGDLTLKHLGICNGCQTISIICDYEFEHGHIPKNQYVKISLSICLNEDEIKQITISNNTNNSVSEKDIIMAISVDEVLSGQVEEYSNNKYSLKLRKGSRNKDTSIVIDLTKQGKTNSLLSYVLEKPYLTGSDSFKENYDELMEKITGEDVVKTFELEMDISSEFKKKENSKYHTLTNGYIKNPIITCVKQMRVDKVNLDMDVVVKLAIDVLNNLTENSEGKLNTWINNKQNSDMYCKTLKYEMMKYQYSKMVELV